MAAELLDPFDLGGLTIQNRVVMSPMTRARAVTDIPDELTVRYYEQRAGAGLIITEGAPISQEGTGYLFTPGIFTEQQVLGWKRVTDAVRAHQGRIFAQLWHVGRASHTSLQAGGIAPVSSTAVASGGGTFAYDSDGTPGYVAASTPRALRTDEIARVASDFAAAAANAHAAGFHGIELHAATGYLFEQFLNAEVNDRTDRYGSRTVADRIRFTLEVIDAVIVRIGAHRTGVRISPFSTVGNMPADGQTVETYRALIEKIADRGLAYVHLHDTSGFGEDDAFLTHRLRGLVAHVRPGLNRTALILAGGLTQQSATELISSGLIDLAAFGRPYISNPDLVERFRTGHPLADADVMTFYGGDAAGYTDYPTADELAHRPSEVRRTANVP